MGWPEFHQPGWKACLTRWAYEAFRPVPLSATRPPRRLSSTLTCCDASGRTDSSFLPMSDRLRPNVDISTSLPGGPSACEASDEFGMSTWTLSTPPEALTAPTRASASRDPNGLTPLKSFCARPSQKLRKLNTALMTDGVLRPVERRTLADPTWKSASSASSVWPSNGSPSLTPVKCAGMTPCEPTTLSVSDSTAEAELFGSESLCSGKSAAVSCALGPFSEKPRPRGWIWWREGLSARAL